MNTPEPPPHPEGNWSDCSSTSASDESEHETPELFINFPSAAEDGGQFTSPDDGEIDNLDIDNSDQPTPFPEQLNALRTSLLQDYVLPEHPPAYAPDLGSLTASEELTLKHYMAWYRSNGTVQAYTLHAKILQEASGTIILSLHLARKLAVHITGLTPNKVDICPRSCIAYTGEFKDLTSCPFVRDRERQPCGQARYKATTTRRSGPSPRAQMMSLPVMATIKAMYSNFESATMLRHRDKCLQSVLHLTATASGQNKRTYSDFGDSDVHLFQYSERNLFTGSRDIALVVSSDGAQLTMKKASDTWLLIIILLNLPPEIRNQGGSVIYTFATPGPLPPGNMESYCYPLFQEMAEASAGIWTWDAVDSSYFVLHAWITMVLGDMLGSAKLSGMAGHSAVHGDRFTMVKGARSSLAKGAKYQYYPINPPSTGQAASYNQDRPSYDFFELPYRNENTYWQTINDLHTARNKTERAKLVTKTGISRLPLCAASEAFIHPSFFPLDPFHLFYENCMTHIWDQWNNPTAEGEIIYLS